MNKPKSYAQLKNRDKLDFNEKEIKILKILKENKEKPKKIAQKMGWICKYDKGTPSGISLYLNRFYKYGWIEKTGKLHSKKDPIYYSLTKDGISILNKFLNKN